MLTGPSKSNQRINWLRKLPIGSLIDFMFKCWCVTSLWGGTSSRLFWSAFVDGHPWSFTHHQGAKRPFAPQCTDTPLPALNLGPLHSSRWGSLWKDRMKQPQCIIIVNGLHLQTCILPLRVFLIRTSIHTELLIIYMHFINSTQRFSSPLQSLVSILGSIWGSVSCPGTFQPMEDLRIEPLTFWLEDNDYTNWTKVTVCSFSSHPYHKGPPSHKSTQQVSNS